MAPSGSAHDMSPLFLGSMWHVPHAAVWHGPLRTTCSQHIKTPYCLLPIRPLPQWCTQRCMLCAFTSNITLTRTPPATAATQKQGLSNTPTEHPFPKTATSRQEPQHHFKCDALKASFFGEAPFKGAEPPVLPFLLISVLARNRCCLTTQRC